MTVCAWTVPAASAQSGDSTAETCTLQNGVYSCNWKAFQQSFTKAHMVAVKTAPRDRIAAAQARELLGKMDKMVAVPEQAADLTFVLNQADLTGVNVGPAERGLALLQVYAPTENGDRKLMWVESYTGQADLPWPAVVHQVLEQFRARFAKNAKK